MTDRTTAESSHAGAGEDVVPLLLPGARRGPAPPHVAQAQVGGGRRCEEQREGGDGAVLDRLRVERAHRCEQPMDEREGVEHGGRGLQG